MIFIKHAFLLTAFCLLLSASILAQPNTDQPILFLSNRTGTSEAYVMNPDGSNLRRVSFGLPTGQFGNVPPREVTSAKWSPDGRKIVISRVVNGPSPGITSNVIVLMNADGSNPVSITEGRHPSLSPDGQKIVLLTVLEAAGFIRSIPTAPGGRSFRRQTPAPILHTHRKVPRYFSLVPALHLESRVSTSQTPTAATGRR